MSDPSPLVSIVIPNKNRRDLVQETLRSLVAQTYPHWEALVIDDASTDGATQAIQETFGTDARIRVLARTGPVGGAQVARNQGTRASCGKYVIYLDNDDLLAPGCLEQRVQVMEQNPRLDFAVFRSRLFMKVPGDTEETWGSGEDLPHLIAFLNLMVPWQTTGPIWTRRALQAVGDWDESLTNWQDWDYHIRSLILNLNYCVFDCWDNYIRRDTSLTDNIHKKYSRLENIQSRIRIFRKLTVLFREAGLLNPATKLSLQVLFFNQARELIYYHGRRQEAQSVWRFCFTEGLINAREFVVGSAGFLCMEDTVPFARLFDHYAQKQFPKERTIIQQRFQPADPNRIRPWNQSVWNQVVTQKEKGYNSAALRLFFSLILKDPELLTHSVYLRLLGAILIAQAREIVRRGTPS